MGKDLKGKELGTGISHKKDGVYGSIINSNYIFIGSVNEK
jgi:hypothetical protein